MTTSNTVTAQITPVSYEQWEAHKPNDKSSIDQSTTCSITTVGIHAITHVFVKLVISVQIRHVSGVFIVKSLRFPRLMLRVSTLTVHVALYAHHVLLQNTSDTREYNLES